MMNDAPALTSAPSVQRILIIKLRHHGDMLLVTPVISSLRQNYPQAQIDVLLYQETQEMLASNPELSTLFAIDRQWKKQGVRAHLGHELALLRRLKAQRYDLVVNLADQWRSAIITRLTGARIRLGFDFPNAAASCGATVTRSWCRWTITPTCIPSNKISRCWRR